MKAGCAAQKLQFEAHGKRDVVADFDGGRMTSDGGGLLLREANCCLGDLMAQRGTDPGALAGDPHPHPRGRGVLPRRDPELVRSQCGGLRARAGSQPGADSALTPRHAPCAAVLLADRRGGAPLPPVPLSHAQLVEPQAARDRQGRAPAAGRQSTLRGDQPGTLRNPVAAAAVRAGLLRPRRDGEPHQGAAAVSVRRPHQQRDDAR